MTPPPSWSFHGNVWATPASDSVYDYMGYYMPGDVHMPSMAAAVSNATAAPGVLPASICAVLVPDGSAQTIGIDFTCAKTH